MIRKNFGSLIVELAPPGEKYGDGNQRENTSDKFLVGIKEGENSSNNNFKLLGDDIGKIVKELSWIVKRGIKPHEEDEIRKWIEEQIQ